MASSDINSITTDPMAKVASALSRHETTLTEHERRLCEIEEAKEQDTRSRKTFTWSMILQAAFFALNILTTYLAGR
jgi:hypothetical protein